VAIARCIRETSDPEQAEVAFVVADEWQRRGVGSLLVHRLSEQARAAGILRWKAEMLAENEGALRLLAKVGPLRSRRMQARGVVEVIHDLSPAEQSAADSRR
jgi:GNAT superfamily N-acetyltransferase